MFVRVVCSTNNYCPSHKAMGSNDGFKKKAGSNLPVTIIALISLNFLF